MSVSALSSSASNIPALLQMPGGKPPVQDTQGAMPPPPPPKGPDGKEKMESLLSSQVQSGNLTQDQADTLKGFFESLATKGLRGSSGPNGSRAAKDKDDQAEGAGNKNAAAPSSPESNMLSKSVSDALATFLKNLQQSNWSGSGYGASAKAATTATTPSLVVDQTV